MIWSDARGSEVIRPAIFAGAIGLVAAMSTRKGGVSGESLGMNLSFRVGDAEVKVWKNRELFFGSLGVQVNELAVPGQIHGAVVSRVDRAGEYPERDGLVTSSKGIALVISIADCVPVLLYDPVVPAVGALHAGWRGSSQGITARGVELMMEEFGSEPGRLLAYIGPAASSCCYRVGEDVASRFPDFCVSKRGEEVFVDLKEANLVQLLGKGVLRRNVEVSPLCTITEDSLHSYRRDGERSGRMMAVISLR
jgi:YfiH family protein